MEIQQLRNLYLNKIIKHINKLNSELSLYNQSSEQYGGSSLASIDPTLGQPQLMFTRHNKSAIDSLLKLKTKIEELKINEQRLNDEKLKLEKLNKELNDRLSELTNSNVATVASAELSLVENQRMLEEIRKLKDEIRLKENRILELENINSTLNLDKELLTLKNNRMIEEYDKSNTKLQTDNKEMSDQVGKLNSNIEKISKESITTLFTRSKELIQFYYNSSIDVRDKTLELIKEIRQLGKAPTSEPNIPDLKQIYQKLSDDSHNEALAKETNYNILTFDKDLNDLKVLLNTKISQAKKINNELHSQYEIYLTEKDRLITELTTQSL
jgi:hypothetical protein